jgi:hypothetical protein
MPTSTVTLGTAHRIEFTFDEDRVDPARFVLGVIKSGSSLFNSLCRDLALRNSRKFVDVAGTFFEHNVQAKTWIDDPAWLPILQPGNTYGGFRIMAPIMEKHQVFVSARKVLMVRDPRDALVSQYFSSAYSHSIPRHGNADDGSAKALLNERKIALASPIDTFVLPRAKNMLNAMLSYRAVAASPTTRVFRYEDWIFRKKELIGESSRWLDLPADDDAVEQMLAWADVRPVAEDPRAFIRKVTPGDHREKLKPETIESLNEVVRPAMELFGYK